jgi:hypothetical protein
MMCENSFGTKSLLTASNLQLETSLFKSGGFSCALSMNDCYCFSCKISKLKS